MAKYRVWVSGDEGATRVHLTDTDDQARTLGLLTSLLDVAGGTGFDLGVTVGIEGNNPVPAAAEMTHATERPQERTQAAETKKKGQSHWPQGQEPR